MREIALLPVAISTGLVLAIGCSNDDDAGTVYKSASGECRLVVEGDIYIGGLFPNSEVWNDGPNWEIAVRIALDDINNAEHGGFANGRRLGLLECNSGCTATTADTAFNELTGTGDNSPAGQGLKIGAIVGPGCTASALAFLDDLDTVRIPVISPSVESKVVIEADTDDFFFRTALPATAFGPPQARYLKKVKAIDTLVVAYNSLDAWSEALGGAVLDTAVDEGIAATAAVFEHTEDNPVVAGPVIAAMDIVGGPDMVYMSGFTTEGSLLFKESLLHNWTNVAEPSWEFCSGQNNDAFIGLVNNQDALEGLGGIEGHPPESAFRDAFLEKYETAKGGENDSIYVFNAFDAVYLAAVALYTAGEGASGDEVRDALRANSASGTIQPVGDWGAIRAILDAEGEVDLDGTSSGLNFDTNGDPAGGIQVQRWEFKAGKVHRETENNCWDEFINPCR